MALLRPMTCAFVLGIAACRGDVGATQIDNAAAKDASSGRARLDYAGDPYGGILEVRIQPPTGAGTRRYGTGTAQFIEQDAGRARLIVNGTIDDKDGDAGFLLDGTYGGQGRRWRAGQGKVDLEIAPDGTITGGGTIHPQQYRFSGHASATDFALVVNLELLEPTANGLPAGTTFRFDYDLARRDPGKKVARHAGTNEKKTSSDNGSSRKCRKIRYEMRPVASIGDGSMSMIQVPVCLH